MAKSKGKHEIAKAKKAKAKPKSKSTPRKKKTNRKNTKKIILVAVLILALLAAAALVGGFAVGRSTKIHPNMVLNGVNVGGMSIAQAEDALKEGGWEEQEAASLLVKLPGDYEFRITSKEAGLEMSSRQAAKAAYAFGHSGNPVTDLAAWFKCVCKAVTMNDMLSSVDGKGILNRVNEELQGYNEILSAGYELDTEKSEIRIIKGAENISIDPDSLCNKIIAAFEENESTLIYDVEILSAREADFDKIHEEVFSELKEAVYDKESGKIGESTPGIDFDVKAAQKAWDAAKPGDTVTVKLTVTEPKYSSEELEKMLFRDKLGSHTTSFSSSSADRATNVELSASKINGIILNPGETFSYNDTVGKRTTAAGFKKASAYSGGEVVQEVGGGICQTSSTLYCAALYANLKINARTCHHFSVSYVPPGLDATVSWGGPEFKFTNNRDLPIKIVTHCENRKLTVEIWGTDIDGSYVEMNYLSSAANNGTSATTYRCVYDKDGNLLSRNLEAKSFYHVHGTTPVKPTPSPVPTPTPVPTAGPTPPPTPVPSPEVPTEPAA